MQGAAVVMIDGCALRVPIEVDGVNILDVLEVAFLVTVPCASAPREVLGAVSGFDLLIPA